LSPLAAQAADGGAPGGSPISGGRTIFLEYYFGGGGG